LNWDTVYTFPKGSICHIHRVVYDQYDDSILVCTGDRDQEVAVYKTKDEFKTIKPIVQGQQEFRTTSLVPLKNCILYGTDNPKGENFVIAIDRKNNRTERVQKIPGPVLYGCRVGDYVCFATMVEKSNHEVTLWVGNEKRFNLVAHFETQKSNQIWREVVGYSTVILPDGIGTWPFLYCTPIGTQHHSNTLIKLNLTPYV
jgi:hypothetical protein